MTYRYIITVRGRDGQDPLIEGVKEDYLPEPNGYFTPINVVSGASIEEVLVLLGIIQPTTPDTNPDTESND